MDKSAKERREKAIIQILEQLSDDLQSSIAELQKSNAPREMLEKFPLEAKSKIHYWLSKLYDEMEAREKNLEIAYDGAQQIIKKLRASETPPSPPQKKIKIIELVTRKNDDR